MSPVAAPTRLADRPHARSIGVEIEETIMPQQVGQATRGISRAIPGLVGVVQDGAAKRAVLEALADPTLGRINFRIRGFEISPVLFARVKAKVEAGGIGVAFNDSLRNPRTGLPFCVYKVDANRMTLGFNSAAGLNERALVIHEATHAACDVALYSAMTTVDSEIMAYIAKAIFLTVKLGSLPFQADAIIANSQILADIVLSGRPLSPNDLISITQAIFQHPDYAGTAAMRVGYDGVN